MRWISSHRQAVGRPGLMGIPMRHEHESAVGPTCTLDELFLKRVRTLVSSDMSQTRQTWVATCHQRCRTKAQTLESCDLGETSAIGMASTSMSSSLCKVFTQWSLRA